MPRAQQTHILAFDIGGTFTDFALINARSGELRTHKRLTTPRDPSLAVLDGTRELLMQAGIVAANLKQVLHATTLVANTLIERNGAVTALLATHGHRDVLDIRTEQRYDVYDLALQYPPPLAPRARRFGVHERIDRDGRVLQAPTAEEFDAIAAAIAQAGAQAVAIAFLHAYRNPANERAAARLLARALARHGLRIPISLSSEVAPEIREYERTSTTVANAYVQPKMQQYLARLQRALRALGFVGELQLMLSSGGSTSARTARAFPIRLVESGPAAGAIAAAHFGKGAGDLLAFDMGGTTAKLCVIEQGRPALARELEVARLHRFKKGSGIPLQFPAIDMIEIGAGGGSIARMDDLGLLKVGPHSAASEPGPACYGLGGSAPTVTDANLLLGYLDPANFAGGRMQLDVEKARAAFVPLARALGGDVTAAAWGVHTLVSENMAGAARMHAIERNRDPRNHALLAYGGGGPIHAAGMARMLGVRRVICPLGAGVGSAIGLLIAPAAYEVARSHPVHLSAAHPAQLNALLAGMLQQCKAQLAAAGTTRGVAVQYTVEGRFAGQLHELALDLPGSNLTTASLRDLGQRFIARYREVYGHLPIADAAQAADAIELIGWRVSARGPQPLDAFHRVAAAPLHLAANTRPAYFGGHGWVQAKVVDRYRLRAGATLRGPALVQERESTAVLPPGTRARVDAQFNLVVEVAA